MLSIEAIRTGAYMATHVTGCCVHVITQDQMFMHVVKTHYQHVIAVLNTPTTSDTI
jgi:hypothetical protein